MTLPNFPRLEIELADPKSLILYNRRARRHLKAKLKKLRRAIREFGWIEPLIVDENDVVLVGGARLTIALEDGIELIPIVRIEHMSEAQKRAYILASNRLAEEAGWDRELLRTEFAGLIELGYDVELTGFDTLEIDMALSFEDSAALEDDDVELPDEAARPICRTGDLWHIGPHRALCGDARDREAVDRVLDGEPVQLFVADPPFGCAISGNVSGLGKVKHDNFLMGAGEQPLPEFAQTLLRPAFRNMAAHAAAGAIAFIFTDWRAMPHMQDAALGVFAEQKNLIVWVKTNAGMGTFYRSAHELILAYKVSEGKHINNFGLGEGGRHRSNTWTYAGANTFRKGRMEDLASHSTVKPKRLIADAILDCSKPGGIVLDPFLGSGTTLVACAMTNRVGRGIELDPKYMDVILRRVAEATGCEPLLDGVRPYSEVAAERAGEDV